MKELTFALLITCIVSFSCQKDDPDFNRLIGKWQLVKVYSLMMGGYNMVDTTDQIIEEYTKDNERIIYDYLGNEMGRCNYINTDSTIVITGQNLNGGYWEYEIKYWFKQDTLSILHDGGFENYNQLFKRIK